MEQDIERLICESRQQYAERASRGSEDDREHSVQEQLRAEALEIAMWAEGRPAPAREVLTKLRLLGPGGCELDNSNQETGVGNAYRVDKRAAQPRPLASFDS
jgi:hypothetical protein